VQKACEKMNEQVCHDKISVAHAFDAMRMFLEKYWERGLKESDEIAILLDLLERDIVRQSKPLDEAMWHNWINAVDIVSPHYPHEGKDN
jgi:hypothetical protein